jgi:hypothetical protein
MPQSLGTTPRRVLTYSEAKTLLTMRPKRGPRQTPGEWARQHNRAGIATLWSVYDGSMRLWWAHARRNPSHEAALLEIAHDWWWDRGGSLSALAHSDLEWEQRLCSMLVAEINPMLGGWDGAIWRENGRLVAWREGPGVVIPAPVTPILGPEERPPHGTHIRGALGCRCSPCELMSQAARAVKREAGRPKKDVR